MKGVFLFLVVVLMAAHQLAKRSHALDFGSVDSRVVPCMTYLTGVDTKPQTACCAGLQRLKSVATTPDDRRQACSCLKEASLRFHNIKPSAISSLPNDCSMPLPFPISTSTDCSKIG